MSDSPNRTGTITHQFMQVVSLPGTSRFDRIYVPLLILAAVLFAGWQALRADWLLVGIAATGLALLTLLAGLKPLQDRLLRRVFDQSHATYIALFTVYALLSVWALRIVMVSPSLGKDSREFYVYLLIMAAFLLRALLTLIALTPGGYNIFFSRIPLWEKVLVSFNEFVAACMLAYVLGGELSRWLQPQVFTLYAQPFYVAGLLFVLATYYLITQFMWVQRWNDWLARNRIWVRLARLFAPLALVMGTLVIVRHFTRLSDPRTANLLGTANLDQTILALSPVVWMMLFFMTGLVYTGSRGLKQRFLPDQLMKFLPEGLRRILSTISDMDMLMIVGLLTALIPLQILLFDDSSIGLIDTLRQQIAQENALIDSSEQALAFLFAMPFYALAVAFLALYASVLANPAIAAWDRDELVKKLPIGFLIIFIITLYLCAIPFSLVLTEGRLPQIPQELGRLLAFDVLIPLLLLYSHYFVLVRIPYSRGQSRWREQYGGQLDRELKRTDQLLDEIQRKIQRSESVWNQRINLRANSDERIDLLYQFIEQNGERDRLNMERLRIVDERQQLAEVSETPVSLAVARLPTRIVSYGIPLLLAFKIYEWAVVNDGLREVANNPNIGVIEFFQTILEQTQF